MVESALDEGINFFDTADMYGGTKSEDFLGRALGRRRDEAVIATKFGWEIDPSRRGAHPDYVRRAVDDSLKRLGTDRIDLYQLHKPDPAVPIRDTLGALADIVRAGKVREIGCSNFSAAQLREAEAAARDGVRFVSVQNEYSLLHRDPETDVLPECGASASHSFRTTRWPAAADRQVPARAAHPERHAAQRSASHRRPARAMIEALDRLCRVPRPYAPRARVRLADDEPIRWRR